MSDYVLVRTADPYLSVLDAGDTVKIQLHSYDDIGPFYLSVDKQCLPELSIKNTLDQSIRINITLI